METKQIIEKTEALIDALRATCSAYGLSGDSSEYKIIVQVFLYKFLNDKFDESTISDNTLKNIYIDDLGGVWIGSYKNGVNQYVEGASSIRNLELGDINTVAEDRYGNYWIGSNDRGILVYNPKSGEVVQHYTTENSALSSNIMAGSYAASDGSIWFGSYNGGLVRCMPSKDHPTQATIHNYRATGDADGLAINNVWSVTEDRWHRIWIATLGGGINRYSNDHYGQVIWVENYTSLLAPDHEYYRNNGRKTDYNIYVKGNYVIVGGLSAYADLQYRHIGYRITGNNDHRKAWSLS